MDPIEFTIRHRHEMPLKLAWETFTNTDAVNRLSGLYFVDYAYDESGEGPAKITGRARAKGMLLEWVEHPARWSYGEYLIVERTGIKGPVSKQYVRHSFKEEDGAITHTTHIRITPTNWVTRWLVQATIEGEYKPHLKKAMKALSLGALHGKSPEAIGGEKSRATKRTRELLDTRLMGLAEKYEAPTFGKNLVEFLCHQPDSVVWRLRPYELADRWDTDRQQALRIMMHGTQEGLFDLHWQIVCPECRGSQRFAEHLHELPDEGHCQACKVKFDLNFDRSIEATFSPIPLGLGIKPRLYCHSSPRHVPHRVGSAVVGQDTHLTVRVTEGMPALRVWSPRLEGGGLIHVGSQNATVENCRLEVKNRTIEGIPATLAPGRYQFEIVHESTAVGSEIYVECTQWIDHVVTAADITATEEFRRYFSAEALAPGMSFSIQNQVFLFTDLLESTNLYEALGDGPAFALIRKHFDLISGICGEHNGSLVKTIGDAVMAVFRKPEDAVRAALEMLDKISDIRIENSDRELELKVGVHAGPCIVMEANDLIDFFGTTVNTSARIQSAASAGELVLSHPVAQEPEVAQVLSPIHSRVQPDSLVLRGLKKKVDVLRITSHNNS